MILLIDHHTQESEMYKLIWSSNTGAFVVHAALEQAGADYQLSEIDYGNDEQRGKEFLKINPAGQIPTLLLPDGTIMTESVAMVIHLADTFADSDLLPKPGTASRAVALRWLVFMTASIYENCLRYYYSQRYTSNSDHAESVKEAAGNNFDRDFDILDAYLDNEAYIAGGKPSIADTYLTMLALWHADIPRLLNRCLNVERLMKDVRKRPTVDKIWAKNCPGKPEIES